MFFVSQCDMWENVEGDWDALFIPVSLIHIMIGSLFHGLVDGMGWNFVDFGSSDFKVE